MISRPSWMIPDVVRNGFAGSISKSSGGVVESGFLLSVFFAPWGPLLRYFGWLVAIVGLALEFREGKSFRRVLRREAAVPLLMLLAWGAVGTVSMKEGIFEAARGFSLLLEFSFSVWLAGRVCREAGAMDRFFLVLTASLSMVVVQTLCLLAFRGDFAGPFSNINSLGLYGVIVFPIFASKSLASGKAGWWILSALVAFVIWASVSSGAWLSSAAGFLGLVLLSARPLRRAAFFLGGASLLVLAFWAILLLVNPSLLKEFQARTLREFRQVASFPTLSKFSTNRSYMWKGTWVLARMRPLSGWGWGDFNREFASANKSWWDAKKMRIRADRVGDAHNMYLNLLVYGGFPTLLLVLWIYWFSWREAWTAFRRSGPDAWFWAGVLASILAILVYNLAGDVFAARYKYASVSWYLLGFAAASAGAKYGDAEWSGEKCALEDT